MKLLVATNNEDKAREILAVLREEFGANADVEVATLAQVGLTSDPEENGKTFAENARIKALATRDEIAGFACDENSGHLRDEIMEKKCADLADYIIIADDSGLCVDALNGEPGIHSARFAQGGRDDSAHAEYSDNNDKMLAVMKDVPSDKRSAHFVTAACVLIPDSIISQNANFPKAATAHTGGAQHCPGYQMFEVEGRLDGHIGTELLGENGFGFDPLFFPVEYEGKLTNAQLTPQQKDAISHRGRAMRKVAQSLKKLML